VFVDDFAINKVPSSNGKKYYISSPSSSQGTFFPFEVLRAARQFHFDDFVKQFLMCFFPAGMSHSQSGEKLAKSSKQTLTRKVTNIIVGDTGKR
jgi:hypothetical protein